LIQCLGVLILNRGDLLLRMIDSIDLAVERLCIVQNGHDDSVAQALQYIAAGRNALIDKVYIERPFRNMGVGPAWNSIIKSFPECEYWLIANNDTVFLPGDLQKYLDLHRQNSHAVIVDASHGFSCFLISPEIIAKVGLFDENIWPIYHEDIDYAVRLQRAGINCISIGSDVGQSNNGSWTIRSNSNYAARNSVTQANNGIYVDQKWGKNQQYKTPWNHSSRDIHDWWYDPYRRKEHSEIWNYFEHTANKLK